MQLPKRYWWGMLLLAGLYTLIRLTAYEPVYGQPDWLQINRQLLRWINMVVVFLAGYWVLRPLEPRWMLLLWNGVHLLLMGYLAAAAAWEYWVAPMPYGIRGSAAPIIEFLISPVYYMALGVLYYLTRPAKHMKAD